MLKSLLQHHSLKASILQCSAFFMVQLSHLHDNWKYHSFDYREIVGKLMSLLFNMLSMLVIAFLPRSKHLLILWLQSPHTVILEPKKIKSVTAFTFSPSICHEVMGPDAMIFVFWMLSFKLAFSLSSFDLIKRLLAALHFLTLEWYHLHIWGCSYFFWQSWFQLVLLPAQHFSWCTLQIS